MRRPLRHAALSTCFLAVLALSACGELSDEASAPTTAEPASPAGEIDVQRSTVLIDDVDIVLAPPPEEPTLTVKGQLPTPCHRPAWDVVDHLDDEVDVDLYTLVDAHALCTQVVEPFDVTIPLRSRGALHRVTINGRAYTPGD
ncbi:MAG: hypothetical protein S0880_23900 [Actinomycetota bacterium]|nr:hypothetical protein [Actinomycetota bacterium]